MTNTSIVPRVETLRVPDALLHYEVRGHGPLVALVGAPMDARPFEPLADRLAVDHTVLTTDPRGINRSPVDDPDRDSTPELRADDLARLLTHLDAGTAVVLGSSGGAVTVLALAQSHPDLLRTVIAHEPPLTELIDDRDQIRAQMEDVIATHATGDVRGAFKKFLTMGNLFLPDEVFDQMTARPDAQALVDDRFQHEHMMRPTTQWQPDFGALRSATPRVLIGLGEQSAGQLCDRTSRALAKALDIEPTMSPGGHIGFAEDPDRFEARLRAVLAEN